MPFVMRAGGLSRMSFRSSSWSSLSALRAVTARLGVWLGVLALLAQVLAPVPQAQAADWMAEGLFPPTCSVHVDGSDGSALPSQQACTQCPLCQLSLGDRLVPLPVVSAPAVVPVAAAIRLVPARPAPSLPAAAHPPLPSRGPPAAA